jgi:hypothetical protein
VYKVLSAFTTGISLALPLFDKIINNAADSDTSFTSTVRGARGADPPPRSQRCC